jgi:hypothetical protein
MKFRFADEVPMSAREFWDTAHSPDFSAFLTREYGVVQRELERETADHLVRRRLRIAVCRNLPDWVCKIATELLGTDEMVYDEIQDIRLDAFELRWSIEPPVLRDKIHGSGRLWLTPIDANHCMQSIEGEILVKIFGVGGKLEDVIVQEIRDSNENLAEVVARWKIRNAASRGGNSPHCHR